ncbi:hypothetical protein D9M70_573290 [compost metagenome]
MAWLVAVEHLGGAKQSEGSGAAAKVVGEAVGVSVVVRVRTLAVGDAVAAQQGMAATVEQIEARQGGGATVVDDCEAWVLALLQVAEDFVQSGLGHQQFEVASAQDGRDEQQGQQQGSRHGRGSRGCC